MRKPGLIVFILIFALLVGWFFFHIMNQGQPINNTESGFRGWFWEKRWLDIAAQILLLFAGALGIAAILPIEDEDDE